MSQSVRRKLEELGRRGVPTRATLELTQRCPARCDYCYIRQEPRIADPPREKITRMLDKLAAAGVLNIHLTGGDPFCRPDITDIISHVIDAGFFNILLFSSGLAMTDDHIAFLARRARYIHRIQLSAFSHREEVNDSCFGRAGASKHIAAAARELKNAGINVEFALNVRPQNIDHFEDAKSRLEQQGYPVTLGFFKVIANARHARALRDETSRAFFDRLVASMSPESRRAAIARLRQSMNAPTTQRHLCRGRHTAIMIDAAGRIHPCVNFRNLVIGDMADPRPLRAILDDSTPYRTLQAMDKDSIETCSACAFSDFCTLCMARIHCEHGAFSKPSRQECHYAHALHAFSRTRAHHR
jgi:radical SAM protein with 4Fe4S-binding SPASM domain